MPRLQRRGDGGWRLARGGVGIDLTDDEIRTLARYVHAVPPVVADDDEIAVCGRLVCQLCGGRSANVDPAGHAARCGHQPVVLTGGLRYVHVGGGRWRLAAGDDLDMEIG
jgi:hypothetical protein